MAVLSEILAALNAWPKWKALNEIPEKVAELERRLAALERGRAPDVPLCPACQRVMTFIIERPEPEPWGSAGARERVWRCSCGQEIVKKVKD